GGDFGSTVSRNLTSARSSIRLPLSAIEPWTLPVAIGTRGEPARAAARLAGVVCAGALGWPGTCGAPFCEGARTGCPGGAFFCSCACNCSCRAFSCGPVKKYCQPINTSADSTMARMVFLLSVIKVQHCHCALHAYDVAPLRNPASYGQTAGPAPHAFRRVHSHVQREAGLRLRAALVPASDGAPGYVRRHFPPSSTP